MIDKSKFVLTQEALKEILDYNPETGEFFWKKKQAPWVIVGKRAGCLLLSGPRAGSRQVKLNDKLYLEHRLVFLYMYGYLPKRPVYHIDGCKDNNRADNLYEVPGPETELNQDVLRRVIEYDPLTGVFVWRMSLSNRSPKGSEVTHTTRLGYVYLSVLGRRYLAHRLAWLYVYGYIPSAMIDHINGDPTDNRIVNLREADSYINQQNRRRANKNNICGLAGVTALPNGRFRAHIGVNWETKHIGIYDDPLTAHQAYIERKRKDHPGCTI